MRLSAIPGVMVLNNSSSASGWTMHMTPAVQPANYAPKVKDISQVVSKSSPLGFAETSTHYIVNILADNNANLTFSPWHNDQTFRAAKSKSDGLPFNEGWEYYKDISGEPIPVFEFQDTTVPGGPTIQNHLCGTVVLDDNNFIAAYVANQNTIAARYGLGIARSSDGGFTWTRNATFVKAETPTNSYYHPVLIRDTATTKYYIIVMNSALGTHELWRSTDGLTGDTYELVVNDIFDGLDVWDGTIGKSAGWACVGQPWLEVDGWHFYATRDPISHYHISPETNLSKVIQDGSMFRTIVECRIEDMSSPTVIVMDEIYTTDEKVTIGIFPGSPKILYDGAYHVLVNSFMFRQENITQVTGHTHVLSSSPILDNARQVRDKVWDNMITKYFIPNDITQNDTFQSTPVYPYEYLSGDLGTVVGSPTVYGLSRIYCTSSDYVTFPSWTHNTQYLGLKMVTHFGIAVFDNVDRGIAEKEGCFKVWHQTGKFVEVWIYGDNGNIKKYRLNGTITVDAAGKYGPDHMVIGFTARFDGIDDMTISINIDDTLNAPATAIHTGTQKFTNIAQNNNPVKIGNVVGIATTPKAIGQCVIFEGSRLTNETWHRFNMV